MHDGGTSTRQLRILGIQDRYPFAYNSPRTSRHVIDRRRFLPLERIYRPMAGGAMINPWPPKPFDLVHSLNRVPLGPTPFVIGFDWHLPLSWENNPGSFKMVMDQLLSPKCRRIVAMSKAAAAATLHRHENHPRIEELRAKTTVRLPNVQMPDMQDWFDPAAGLDQLRLVFVGDHFARKGGCVAVKLAEKALAAGLPIHVTIVSSLSCGNGIWTNPDRAEFYEPYLKLLDQPNVTVLKDQPPAKIPDLLAKSHLTFLPTLGDACDYTVIEGMARFTPVFATATSAFPEFIDADNGVLLPVETTCQGEWKHIGRADRGTPEFEAVFAGTVEQLADQAFAACADFFNTPSRLAAMRKAARRTAEEKFDAVKAARFWDQLYLDAVEGR
jgi:glycosyltransferase involved in cell wall biosynthesis